MRYFHIPNFHFAIPSWFKLKMKPLGLHYKIKFNDSCRYNLDNLDQQDWNKLNGITNAVFGNAQYSQTFMMVWRYNVITKKFEIGAYLHNYPEQERSTPEDNKTVYVMDGDSCDVMVLIQDKIRLNIDNSTVEIPTNIKFNHIVRETNPWFGGNNPAPQFIHFEVEFNVA